MRFSIRMDGLNKQWTVNEVLRAKQAMPLD